VAQTAWNKDVMDGTGASGMTLDQTKLNVYEIQFQYLGAGQISFCIENPTTGRLVQVHAVQYANTETTATLTDPSLHLTMIAKTETGYSGGAIAMNTASMAGFKEGLEGNNLPAFSVSATKGITTSELNVLTLHTEVNYQGTRNKVHCVLTNLSVASEASKIVTIRVVRNPTEVSGTVSLADVDADASVMQYDTAGTSIIGGSEKFITTLGSSEANNINMEHLGIKWRPGDRIVFTANKGSGASADVTIGVTWKELI
jgi:hypothetical protein